MRTLFFLSVMLLAFNAWAELKIPKLFSDNMVLQRDIPAPVWGWADPGEKVTVKFKGQEQSVIADAGGKWIVRLKPLAASAQPEKLTITGKTDRKEFNNVVVGDVWLCSGQSNMASCFEYLGITSKVEGVDYPQIRLIGGLGKIVPVPQDLVFPHKSWEPCKSANVKFFSCVGYYFGLKLWQELQIPIGLVNVSCGSSSIEAWMPPESFAANERWKDNLAEMEKIQKTYRDYGTYTTNKNERLLIERCSACLYTYAIRPIIPFGIKGVIWYQGETNLSDDQYARKQQSLIETWRKLWGQGDPATGAGQAFPFYIVQIAPVKRAEGFMPGFWLEQYKAVSKTKNTGIASTVDISDINTSHPKNKRDVGLRLALLALRNTYGRKGTVASGPVYKSMQITGGKIIVSFNEVGAGLTTKDGNAPDWFEIADADGRFVKAQAKINGANVEVSTPDVKTPKFVRFAWNDIAEPNLRNKEGLPAFPFNNALPFFR